MEWPGPAKKRINKNVCLHKAAYVCVIVVCLLKTEALSHNCEILTNHFSIESHNCEILTCSCEIDSHNCLIFVVA